MQCIHRTPFTMVVRTLGIVLLFSLVATLSGLPTAIPDPANTHKEHTLSTDLQPPPLEKEHHATVYIINLYAVKNNSGSTSEEMFENEIIENVPDILEPLATVLLVVEDDDEERERHSPTDLDEFAAELESQGIMVDKIKINDKSKVLKMNLEKEKAQKMIESASIPIHERKDRQKRTLYCKTCRGGGYGGGYGGGGYPSGGGSCPTCGGGNYYPPSGGGGVVPITGGAGHYRKGGGGGGYYPSGGGCSTCGGGGGGGSWSQSSASAQSSSGSWGKK
ncbi:uncharacterized protein LOC126853716 isoform X2 [Cataglyphis hispanica]|uniref:uncharacterized protein LOC126853716 isoform X2 n=1 Tax=Cataglyphis hispanica TaxID=1086592 RepID=UPI00217F7304|nr:uncharacterized protein LOC126853716 isoform X2 [Cataglyphis hispanica]